MPLCFLPLVFFPFFPNVPLRVEGAGAGEPEGLREDIFLTFLCVMSTCMLPTSLVS